MNRLKSIPVTLSLVLLLTAGCGTVTVVPDFLPLAVPGVPYSARLATAEADLLQPTWTVTHGSLPEGLALDPSSGIIGGVPTGEDGLSFFVVEVKALLGAADDEVFGIRVGREGTVGPMRDREMEFEERYRRVHCVRGMTHACEACDDPDGRYEWSQYGDSGCWSGTMCAGTAWRYAVTRDPDDLEKVRLCATALDRLRRITGQPGLLARGYAHRDDSYSSGDFTSFQPEDPSSPNHRGEGEWEDWYWRGDVSRDQYTGVMLGWLTLYEATEDEEIRALARENLEAMGDHIWDHGLRIVESGEMTTHGQLSGYWIDQVPFVNGFNALICLAWFKAIHHVTGLERFAEYHDTLLGRRYLELMDLFVYAYMGYETKWFNVHMAFDNIYIYLKMLEDDRPLHDEVVRIFEKWLWDPAGLRLGQRHARLEMNPWFSFLHADGTGERDAVALYLALVNFSDYPIWIEHERYVDNSWRPEVVPNPDHPEWAIDPLPIPWRHSSNFVWHRCPYTIAGGTDTDREYAGNGYITPYWLGRYAGVIDPTW